MTQNINVTLHPLNSLGVPLTDVMDYPSRSNSSSVGSEGTFYIKKSNQGVYLVETKLNPIEIPVLESEFLFDLTLDLIGPLAVEHNPNFSVYDLNGVQIQNSSYEYNETTGKWRVYGTNGEKLANPDGYWVDFNCDNGVSSQYPKRYKEGDKRNEADLILPGSYTDSIPYFKITGTFDVPTFTPVRYEAVFEWEASGTGQYAVFCAGGPTLSYTYQLWVRDQILAGRHVSYDNYYYTTKMNYKHTLNVKSSIPYNLTENTIGGNTIMFGLYSNTIAKFVQAGHCEVNEYVEGIGYTADAQYVNKNFKVTGSNYTYDSSVQPLTNTITTEYPAGEVAHQITLDITATAGEIPQYTAWCYCFPSGEPDISIYVPCTSEFFGIYRLGGFSNMVSLSASPVI